MTREQFLRLAKIFGEQAKRAKTPAAVEVMAFLALAAVELAKDLPPAAGDANAG